MLVNGAAGPDYILQMTTNLAAPVKWLPIATNALASPPLTFTDSGRTDFSQKFYRVQLGP